MILTMYSKARPVLFFCAGTKAASPGKLQYSSCLDVAVKHLSELPPDLSFPGLMYQAERLLHETPLPILGVLLVQPGKACRALHRHIVGTVLDLLPSVHNHSTNTSVDRFKQESEVPTMISTHQ